MVRFAKDEWVWIPHEEEGWIPVRMDKLEDDKVVLAVSEGDEIFRFDISDDLEKALPVDMKGIDDLSRLDELSEASILHNLKVRFKKDTIYTTVAGIYIAINPFKNMSLYTTEIMEKYSNCSVSDNVPPHIYELGRTALRGLFDDKKSQSILISGDSGSGKTETAKFILQYVAEVSGHGGDLEQQIVHANPILEAFGNAQTVRNSNSSRFGKWMEILFESQKISGMKISQYLLEMSRVVSQADQEQNYHIFYHILSSSKYCSMFSLSDSQYNVVSNPPSKDLLQEMAIEHELCLNSMKLMNFSEETIDEIFRVVAVILHLGNVSFSGNNDNEPVSVVDTDSIQLISSMLGISHHDLKTCFCTRKIKVVNETVQRNFSDSEALKNVAALCKFLYKQLFEYIVSTLNSSLSPQSQKSSASIGILDIFGFEDFDKNHFEQLCINYANEKLQKHFNDHVYKLEQVEYEREKISVEFVSHVGNNECLELFESKSSGIISLLNEELRLPKGSDEGLLMRFHESHMNSHVYIKPMQNVGKFSVRHYAGHVSYHIEGFLTKNQDALSPDVKSVLRSSSNLFLKSLTESQSELSKTTIISSFKDQLAQLLESIGKTQPQFVRCLKASSSNQPDEFDSLLVLRQLRYLGLESLCLIRQQGFPIRFPHDEFILKYRFLVPDVDTTKLPAAEAIESILNTFSLDENLYKIGSTKLFLKYHVDDLLSKNRHGRFLESAKKMRSRFRYKQSRNFVETVTNLSKQVIICKEGMFRSRFESKQSLLEAIRIFDEFQRELANSSVDVHSIEKLSFLIQEANQSYESMKSIVSLSDQYVDLKANTCNVDFDEKMEKIDEIIKEMSAVKNSISWECIFLEDNISQACEMYSEMKQYLDDLDNVLERVKREEFSLELQTSIEALLKTCTRLSISGELEVRLQSVLRKVSMKRSESQSGKEKDSSISELLRDADSRKEKISAQKSHRVEELEKEAHSFREQTIQDIDIAKLFHFLTLAKEYELKVDDLLAKQNVVKEYNRLYEKMNVFLSFDNPTESELYSLAQEVESFQEDNNCSFGKRSEDTLDLLKKIKHLDHLLSNAISSKDLSELQHAIKACENAKMEPVLFSQAKSMFRDLSAKQVQSHVSHTHEKSIQNWESCNWMSYPYMRSCIDFYKGFGLLSRMKRGKKKIASEMLVWVSGKQNIPKSLTMLSVCSFRYSLKELEKESVLIFKRIQCLMGDRSGTASEDDIIREGLYTNEIRDEIFCLIMKQLSNNPRQSSRERGWHLFATISHNFSPSSEFIKYVYNFVETNLSSGQLSEQSTKYANQIKVNILHKGGGGVQRRASETEIEDHSMFNLPVHLSDGTVIELESIHYDEMISETVKRVYKEIGVSQRCAKHFILGVEIYAGYSCVLDPTAKTKHAAKLGNIVLQSYCINFPLEPEFIQDNVSLWFLANEIVSRSSILSNHDQIEFMFKNARFNHLRENPNQKVNEKFVKAVKYFVPGPEFDLEFGLAQFLEFVSNSQPLRNLCSHVFKVSQAENVEYPSSLQISVNSENVSLLQVSGEVLSSFRHSDISFMKPGQNKFVFSVQNPQNSKSETFYLQTPLSKVLHQVILDHFEQNSSKN